MRYKPELYDEFKKRIANYKEETEKRLQTMLLLQEFRQFKFSEKEDYIALLFRFLMKVVKVEGIEGETATILNKIVFETFGNDPKADYIIPRFIFALAGLRDLILLDPDAKLKLPYLSNKFAPGLELPDIIYAYSKKDIPLLLCGETGTSKGMLADAIVEMSSRRNNPYRSINCAAIPESILESELFGYKEGVFTGAKKGGKHGIFHFVDGGTLFLDELAAMPKHLQPKLLKVIEDKQFYPVGSEHPEKIDIRFIAATQPRLKDDIYPDLLWRLGYPDMIELPPLRERLKAFPYEVVESSLIRVFKKLKLENRLVDPYVTPVIEEIGNYEFPGNYRELENILRRAIILTDITGANFNEYLRASIPTHDNAGDDKADSNSPDSYCRDINGVPLKDVLDHAEKIGQSIVERKLREVLKSGGKIKNVLMKEGLNDKEYQSYYCRLRRVIGKRIRDM
ncbi:MAG TPA: sigma 54-interacting transcriptional regulator [Thermodesulfovibrionales bacterium]|nr:sigma 54-interacting transcriptional regulator [Thermodesulfovibrionales bacterium]